MAAPHSIAHAAPTQRRPIIAVVAELRAGLRRAAADLDVFERDPVAGAAEAFSRQLEGLRRSARDLLVPEGRAHD